MLNITTPTYAKTYTTEYPVIIVPTGYPQSPDAFDTTAVDILRYFQNKQFDIKIHSSPETFATFELNSNLKRLGKFAVKEVALPTFLSIMANFIYEHYTSVPSVDSEPVNLTVCIEVCDSNDMKVNKRIDFEGCAEQFDEMASNISDLLNNGN